MSSIAKKTIKCTCTIDIYWIKPPLSFCLRNDKRQLSKMKFIMGWNGWKTEWLPLSLSKIMLLFIIHRKTGSLSSISASLFLPSEKPCRKRDCSLFRHSFWAELFLCFLSSFLRVYSFFQLFGNSPSRALGSRNLNSFLGRRVVAFTGFALADFECTEDRKSVV